MKRLKDVYWSDLIKWQKERLEAGQVKYKDAHLQRYGLVDVVEEILDALNILELMKERLSPDAKMIEQIDWEIRRRLHQVLLGCQRIDGLIADEFCTDEKGGKRIWWSPEG